MNGGDNEDDDLRIPRTWMSTGRATFGYGMAMTPVTLWAAVAIAGIGARGCHGCGMAAALFTVFVSLPAAVVAMLFTMKMSQPRWPKALAACAVWLVSFVAAQL